MSNDQICTLKWALLFATRHSRRLNTNIILSLLSISYVDVAINHLQMFEVSDYVLKRDSASLLSQLCDENPPVLKDPNGVFYFDRDWWLFRYILIFLRDGSLPQDRNLLAQLYREAAFWHLVELQKAIEEDKLHLRGKADEDSEKSSWWRKALSVPNVALSEKAEKEKKSETDWWTGTSYKGVQYLPLSSSPGKTTTKKGANDVLRVPENTWYAYQEQHRGW